MTWYSAIVHEFTRIYQVCSTYELTNNSCKYNSNHAQKWRQICPKVFNPSEFHFSEVTFFQNWYFSNVLMKPFYCCFPCLANTLRNYSKLWSLNQISSWFGSRLTAILATSDQLINFSFTGPPEFKRLAKVTSTLKVSYLHFVITQESNQFWIKDEWENRKQ